MNSLFIYNPNNYVSCLVLFGSQACDEATSDSDWDLLILLEGEKVSNEDLLLARLQNMRMMTKKVFIELPSVVGWFSRQK